MEENKMLEKDFKEVFKDIKNDILYKVIKDDGKVTLKYKWQN